MTHDVVLERLSIAHVDARRLLRVDVINKEVDDWVWRTRLRIRFDVQRVVQLRETRRQIEVGNLALVEPIEGELLSIGRPPHRRALAELFAVHPTRGAVLDARLYAALGRDRCRA